jgi:hypothetical protein
MTIFLFDPAMATVEEGRLLGFASSQPSDRLPRALSSLRFLD